MSFWNNPENNPVKMLLVIVAIAGIGAFVFYSKNTSEETTGRVINTGSAMQDASVNTAPVAATGSPANGFQFSTTTHGTTCTTMVCSTKNTSQCISLTGTTAANGSCTPDAKQSNAQAQGLLAVMNGTAQ